MSVRARLGSTGLVLFVLAVLGRSGPAQDIPPRARDCHGDPLPPGATARMGSIRFCHGSQVKYVAFLPDGKTVVSAGADDAVRVWESSTGRELRTWRPSELGLNGVRFSPDGTAVAVTEDGQTTRLLDVATGKERHRVVLPSGVTDLAVAPGGKTLALLGNDEVIYRWTPEGGKAPEVFVKLGQPPAGQPRVQVTALTFSRNGKVLAAASARGATGVIREWDLATGRELPRLTGLANGVHALSLSPDLKSLAAIDGQQQALHVFDLATGKLIPQPGQVGVQALAHSPDGATLALTTGDVIFLRDAATGKSTLQLQPVDGNIASLAFSPDGKYVVAGGESGRVILWDLAAGKEVRLPDGHPDRIVAIALSPDGKACATAGADQTVRLWDPATGKPLRRLAHPAPPGGIPGIMPGVALAFVQGGQLLASGYFDGTVILWRVATGEEVRSFQADPRGLAALAAAPDGKTLATAGAGGVIRLWDVATARELRQFKTPAPDGEPATILGLASHLAFSPDGRIVALAGLGVVPALDGSVQTTVRCWEMSSGKQRRQFPVPLGTGPAPGRMFGLGIGGGGFGGALGLPGGDWGAFSSLTFAPGGRRLAVGAGDTVLLWDVPRAREVRRFAGAKVEARSILFTPDGKLLLAGDSQGRIHFWDVDTGTALFEAGGHRGAVTALSLSRDGKILVSAATDTSALTWDVARLVETGRASARALSSREVDALWSDLAAADAARAFTAICTLAAHPSETVPYLRARLRPVPEPDRARIERLIADLNSEHFEVRSRAAAALEKLGDLAEPAVRQSLRGRPALEVRRRLDQLLEKIEGPITDAEMLRSLRAIEVLEQIGTPEARRDLEFLARGAPGARMTREAGAAVERLAKAPPAGP